MTGRLPGGAVERCELTIPVYAEKGTVLRGCYPLSVPPTTLTLTQGVLSGESPSGQVEFEVTCGAGLGGDHVTMRWVRGEEEHQATFYLRDVLRAWATEFDAAARMLPTMKVDLVDPAELP